MKNKNKYFLLIFALIIITSVYFFLLNKFKKDIDNIVNDLPYGYNDYYSDEFLNNIEKYNIKNNSIDIFYVLDIRNQLYESVNTNTCYKTNGLTPSVYIYTYDNSGLFLEKSDGYKDCTIVYIDKNGNAIFDYESKIKVRGNSTSTLDKKPYNIKFSEKQNLLNAGYDKKWNLLAEAYDPTLLRNNIFLSLADKIGLDYTSTHHYVEVYIDQQYVGCYLLTEAVETGKDRVNIDIDNKDFFLEFESYRVEDDVYYFVTKHNIRLALKEPEEPSDKQLSYYQETIDKLDDVLFSNDYDELCKYFDLDSFAKLYLINEFAKTRDFINSSVNFYYKNGKLYAGPVWDFDLSAGNSDSDKKSKYWDELNDEKVSYLGYYCRNYSPIFNQFFKYDEFNDLYISYFNKYKDELLNIFEDGGFIDSTISTYGSIFERNYAKIDKGGAGWNVSLLQDTLQTIPLETYQENVDYLKDFLKNRYNWLSNNK